MKRDMDLIRELLLAIQDQETWDKAFELQVEGRNGYEVAYHLQLLESRGLIEGIDASTHSGPRYFARTLTWEGHEFLDNAKNETFWQQAKKRIGEAGGSVSFDVVKALLSKVALKAVTGDDLPGGT
jgi:repressor of nif and glnA expression